MGSYPLAQSESAQSESLTGTCKRAFSGTHVAHSAPFFLGNEKQVLRREDPLCHTCRTHPTIMLIVTQVLILFLAGNPSKTRVLSILFTAALPGPFT